MNKNIDKTMDRESRRSNFKEVNVTYSIPGIPLFKVKDPGWVFPIFRIFSLFSSIYDSK